MRLLTMLDAAYAQAGQFPEAIAAAQKAHDIAVASGDKSAADAASDRIIQYRNKQVSRPSDSPH